MSACRTGANIALFCSYTVRGGQRVGENILHAASRRSVENHFEGRTPEGDTDAPFHPGTPHRKRATALTCGDTGGPPGYRPSHPIQNPRFIREKIHRTSGSGARRSMEILCPSRYGTGLSGESPSFPLYLVRKDGMSSRSKHAKDRRTGQLRHSGETVGRLRPVSRVSDHQKDRTVSGYEGRFSKKNFGNGTVALKKNDKDLVVKGFVGFGWTTLVFRFFRVPLSRSSIMGMAVVFCPFGLANVLLCFFTEDHDSRPADEVSRQC